MAVCHFNPANFWDAGVVGIFYFLGSISYSVPVCLFSRLARATFEQKFDPNCGRTFCKLLVQICFGLTVCLSIFACKTPPQNLVSKNTVRHMSQVGTIIGSGIFYFYKRFLSGHTVLLRPNQNGTRPYYYVITLYLINMNHYLISINQY